MILFSIFIILLLVCSGYSNYAVLKTCGYEPTSILEVGKETGAWSRKMKKIFPSIEDIFLVDSCSDSECQKTLDFLQLPYEVAYVGNYTGIIAFTDQEDNNKSVQFNITTIDEIIQRRNVGPIQMMKLDLQGGEYDAILGAIDTLRAVEVIQTEVPLLSSPFSSSTDNVDHSFIELHLLMEKLGFSLFQVTDLLGDRFYFWTSFEAIWIRRESKLWDQACTGYPRFQSHPKSVQKFLNDFDPFIVYQ
jgi:hypothetical protein